MSKKIYINPGHSDKDPGAVGYETERDLNVRTASFMSAYLIANYDCEIKVTPGSMNKLADICKHANQWGADLFVSIHNNAGGGDGYEALVVSEARRDLGEVFVKHVIAIGQNSRGVKYRPGLVVLRDTYMPAILNEGAFVDNKKDITDWNDDAELKKLGIAYAKATAEYLKLEKKVTKIETVSIELPVLSQGVKDNQSVKAMQTLLKGYGYSIGATGNFGKGTKTVVEKYQKDNDLAVTGVADKATWEALLGKK